MQEEMRRAAGRRWKEMRRAAERDEKGCRKNTRKQGAKSRKA
jgi:hypothetical protein